MSSVSNNPALHIEALPPLSLYIHIPWCVRKCPYCDFNSHTASQDLPEAEYIDCLIDDLVTDLPLVQGRPLQSIFFGGGTPSLFSGRSIGRLLEQIEQRVAFANDIEITLEANPGTTKQQKFHDFYQAGINRLSIGIQSFNENHLKVLGRIHNANEALTSVNSARAAGFDNFNLDLMHGLPDQTPEQAKSDLQQAIDLKPSHLSWYQLTLETNTEFFNNPPTLPGEDLLADIQAAGEEFLGKNNFQQYEVSAYSLEGRQSKHNKNYWQFGDYIGIGAGAHGKNTDLRQKTISRNWKTRLPRDYMDSKKAFCAGNKIIPTAELPFEFMMNVLRLNEGVEKSLFEQRCGQDFKVIQEKVRSLVEQKFLEDRMGRIKTTPLGQRYLNTVIEQFL